MNVPGAVEENSGVAPLLSSRSNVRHIKGILPVVYKPQEMAASTKVSSEIMFATGNANKLREVLTCHSPSSMTLTLAHNLRAAANVLF